MTGIRAFMTNKMKVDLRACGFSEEQLAELTPQEGDEILAAANIVAPDSNEVRKFIEIIVAQARAATQHLKEPGLLQVSLLHPLSEDMGPFRDLAQQYLDRAVVEHNANSTGDVSSKKLDAWLRERLHAEVPKGLIEAAFEQVMKLVFAT